MIYHLYYGTSGNAGLYLDEIYQVLKENGLEQRVFVNYYYPFNYGDKVFFRFGDVGHSKLSSRIRKVVQLVELLSGFGYILLCSIKDRPKLINYSHVANSYLFIRVFLRTIKWITGARLIITCHDVNCHMIGGELENRKKVFEIADNLLVHTLHSKKELHDYFNIDLNKIVSHPFPIMDLTKLSPSYKGKYKKCDFLFIGHLRKDKGIQLLLDAWPKFHQLKPKATLRICGKTTTGVAIDYESLRHTNVELNIRFIPDDDYFEYVRSARFVILPYLEGTNSGIISTVLSIGTGVITSDLPMFSENPLVENKVMFKTGDVDSLIERMLQVVESNSNNISDLLERYKDDFTGSVARLYCTLYKR